MSTSLATVEELMSSVFKSLTQMVIILMIQDHVNPTQISSG